jgi:hypothetical protein
MIEVLRVEAVRLCRPLATAVASTDRPFGVLFKHREYCGTKFLLRTCVDRLADDGRRTISAAMKAAKVKTRDRVEVRDAEGAVSKATLDVKYQRLRVHPQRDSRH